MGLRGPQPSPVSELFWSKVDTRLGNGGCWLWTGYIMSNGYGRYQVRGTTWWTHRLAWFLTHGTIPDGLHLDHLCRNRACCNPAHLEPVTQRENTLRGTGPFAVKAKQTHCIHGHEFTPENTRVKKNGTRDCKRCNADLNKRRYHERKKNPPA